MKTKHPIVLCSNSPRRKELLEQMDLDFDIWVPNIEEVVNSSLPYLEIPEDIARQKIAAAIIKFPSNYILISADTMVFHDGKSYGKPSNLVAAQNTLSLLSNKAHEVVTGVCIYSEQKIYSFNVSTLVLFGELTSSEIDYYLDKYKPFDKAGSYGIQEWIGHTKIIKVEGSFTNVIGLPTEKLYASLKELGILSLT